MNKLLVVFNTCGIRRESPSRYVKHIESILKQDFDNFHVAISSCKNSEECIEYLKLKFKKDISYNVIKDKLPISVTFNDTVEKCVGSFGEFQDYMFIDSGIDFEDNSKVLRDLTDLHESGPYSMTCARTDDDMGFDDWFGSDILGDNVFSEGNLIVPVGKAVNLHVQIFSNQHLQAYSRILPDIFAGQCMESTFSFMCAAINKKWIVHKDLVLKHITGMDGPSSGFSPAKFVHENNMPRWNHMFKTNESIVDIISRGVKYGMGYEENQKIVIHDDSQYDENGFCKNENLKTYIKENMYLDNSKFNYNEINGEFQK